MRRLAIALLLLTGMAWAQPPGWVTLSYEPPAPKVPAPWVKVPEVAPAPTPPPVPGAVPKLGAGELYVLDSAEPSFHVPEPDGPLAVSEVPGPVTLYAKFVGGSGDYELKTFAGKKVYIVRAVRSGRGSVIVVKEGAKSAADVFRQQIDANVGPLPPPVPPPGPNPPPPPDPTPTPAPIPDAGLRVLMVRESKTPESLKPTQRAILYGAKVRDHLDSVCVKAGGHPEWRVYDPDQNTAGESRLWQDVMKRKRTSLPWLVISNGVRGYEGPLPETVDAFLELLKKYE
jgi:hypothetical protein